MNDLDGTTVVITGAASGLGRAFAEGFLADGATVVGTDIDADGLATIAAKRALTSVCDVSVDADVRSIIDLAVRETGRIDVLIDNAGYANATRVEDLADGEFEKLVAVHLFGCIYGMRAAIPVMRTQGRGRIINLVSRAAEATGPNTSAYAAAKAGIFAASRVTATEVANADILVNMLFPGPTNTGIWGTDMPSMNRQVTRYIVIGDRRPTTTSSSWRSRSSLPGSTARSGDASRRRPCGLPSAIVGVATDGRDGGAGGPVDGAARQVLDGPAVQDSTHGRSVRRPVREVDGDGAAMGHAGRGSCTAGGDRVWERRRRHRRGAQRRPDHRTDHGADHRLHHVDDDGRAR